MNPDDLSKEEIWDSWIELAENTDNPAIKSIVKHAMTGMEKYVFDDVMEWADNYDAEEAEEYEQLEASAAHLEETRPGKFDDNPEVVCINAVGIEDGFDEGATYVAKYLDTEFSVVYDRNGVEREVLTERFKEVRGAKPEFEFAKFEPGTKVNITGEPMPYRKHFS